MIIVTPNLADSIEAEREYLTKYPATVKCSSRKRGAGYRPGDRRWCRPIWQDAEKDRAEGPDGRRRGEVAEAISKAVQADGGLITPEDMAAYKVIEREPVRGSYRGREIVSMPPPSSGVST